MVQTHVALDGVFLSASVPDPMRHARYYKTTNLINIRDAVCSLAELVLPAGELVFGGHPAISPMVGSIAQQLGRLDAVSIYQSEFFKSVIPPASMAFGSRIRWVPEVPGDREASLEQMRTQMIAGAAGDRKFSAGFFIGGMEGVEQEFELFRRYQPHAAFWCLASTGGAARILFDNARSDIMSQPAARNLQPAALEELLERELNYRKVVRTLLAGP